MRSGGGADHEWVEVHTRSEPKGVTLDPRVQTGDWNFLNNHKSFGLFSNPGRVEPYLDTYFDEDLAGSPSPSASRPKGGTTTPAA